MLKLNAELAKSADSIASTIQETGKFVGTITRAEKLVAGTGTIGLGLSFKADNGMTADYLDLYHTKANGEKLSSLKTVNAILCCARVSEAQEGPIKCEKWIKSKGGRDIVQVTGYPALMGKRIGFLLRKTLESDDLGKDRTRMDIFAVFSAETELTASEMYARATKPERLSSMFDALMARPVIDKRTSKSASSHGHSAAGPDRFDGMPDEDFPL